MRPPLSGIAGRVLALVLVFLASPLVSFAARASKPVPALSRRAFANPPLEARPGALWPWLNGYVDKAQITRELEEMKAKGMRGAIIWDIGSLADPDHLIPAGPAFLGDASLAAIHHAIDEASRLGLELGLVASSSWNAGGAWVGPEDASQVLLWSETPVDGPRRIDLSLPLPPKATDHYHDVAVLAVPQTSAEAPPDESAVVDLSAFLDGTGRFTWSVPAGSFKILRFVRSNTGQRLECPSPHSDGLVVDHLSRHAIQSHLGFMLERLRQRRANLGSLKYLFLDSYEVWEGVDWTGSFVEHFIARNGYDPTPYLPALGGLVIGSRERTDSFRHDYSKTVSDLIIENHFEQASKILSAHGLRLIAEAGHGGYARVDPLKAMGAVDIPMGEFWNGAPFWVTKEAASAAHVYGKKLVPAESLTGWRHWQDGPLGYKRLVDVAFAAGLNQVTLHTFEHNPPEAGLPGFAYHAGEHFNLNSTWWRYAKPMLDYMSRCSYMLQQGQFVADVLAYYGDQAPNLVPSRRIDPSLEPKYGPTQCLHCGRPKPVRLESLGPGYDYDYVSEEALLSRVRFQDGRLVLPDGMSYRVLVLPDRAEVSLEALRKIRSLIEAGAVVVGRRPQRSNSLRGYPSADKEIEEIAARVWGPSDDKETGESAYGKGKVIWNRPLRDVMAELQIGPDLVVENVANADQHIDYIHRRTDREDYYFVSNSALGWQDVRLRFRVDGHRVPELWNALDGSVLPWHDFEAVSGGVRLHLEMPPVSSMFVVFGKGNGSPAGPAKATPGCGLEAGNLPPALALDRPWTVTFPDRLGAPHSVPMAQLVSWTDWPSPDVKYFSGTAVYSTELVIPENAGDRRLSFSLDLGSVKEIAEVSVNGRSLGVLWTEPFRIDVTRAIRPGPNVIEVAVTNLWNNRIVGDLQPGNEKEYSRTNLKHKFSARTPLIPSGLLGPVVIRRGLSAVADCRTRGGRK